MELTCSYCQELFNRPGEKQQYEHAFCCKECYRKWQKINIKPPQNGNPSVAVPCAQCGKELKRMPSRLAERPHAFCNWECYTLWRRGRFAGPEAWQWKGGRSKRLRMTTWRRLVLKQGNYVCAMCGSTKKLQAHHIKPFSEYPDLRMAVDNGICLCKECHRGVHMTRQNQLSLVKLLAS